MIKTKQLVKTNELPYRFYMAKNSHQLSIQQKGNSLFVFMYEYQMAAIDNVFLPAVI